MRTEKENKNTSYAFIFNVFFSDWENTKYSLNNIDKDIVEARKIMSLSITTVKISMYVIHFNMWVCE